MVETTDVKMDRVKKKATVPKFAIKSEQWIDQQFQNSGVNPTKLNGVPVIKLIRQQENDSIN